MSQIPDPRTYQRGKGLHREAWWLCREMLAVWLFRLFLKVAPDWTIDALVSALHRDRRPDEAAQ